LHKNGDPPPRSGAPCNVHEHAVLVGIGNVREDAMTRSHEMRQRQMRNYRFMFRVALVSLAISVVMTLLGVLRVFVDSQTEWLVFGLLMVIWSVGSLYLTVDSTVRVIEAELRETRDGHAAF
jgi:hypothetical protein